MKSTAVLVQRTWMLGAWLVMATGCVSRQMPIDAARDIVRERSGLETAWQGEPREADAKLRKELLGKSLTAETAAQLALLSSPDVQAALDQTGMDRAALLGALALPNPRAELALRFHGDETEIDLHASIDLVALAMVPARESAASDALDAASLEAAARVLGIGHQARVAFYDYAAKQQLLGLHETMVFAAAQSAEFAALLDAAGNRPALVLATQQAALHEARLAAAQAEAEMQTAREELSATLGLRGGEATNWKSEQQLAMPDAFDASQLEATAIDKSLELQALQKRYAAHAAEVDVAWVDGLLPHLSAGVSADGVGGEWAVGPVIGLSVPLFNQGQGRVALAEAQLASAKSTHHSRSLKLRTLARQTALQLQIARKSATFVQETLIPARRKVLHETLLQYNAMNTGPEQVIIAKRDVLMAEAQLVVALRDYWSKRSAALLLGAGGSPSGAVTMSGTAMPAAAAGGGGGH